MKSIKYTYDLNGVEASLNTLQKMRDLINYGKNDPNLRIYAVRLIEKIPEKNYYLEIKKIFEFVRDNIKYVRDINGIETLHPPQWILANGYGDCDDQTILLATLLELIGVKTRIVLVGTISPNYFNHVLLEAFDNKSGWIVCDPIMKDKPLNWGPKFFTRYIEGMGYKND